MGKRSSKKAHTTPQADPLVILVPPMVPITQHQPELKSDLSNSSSTSSSHASSLDKNAMNTGDEDQNDEEDVLELPSPPPTIGKCKHGKPPSKASQPSLGRSHNSICVYAATENNTFP
jgi:hypothetical protein